MRSFRIVVAIAAALLAWQAHATTTLVVKDGNGALQNLEENLAASGNLFPAVGIYLGNSTIGSSNALPVTPGTGAIFGSSAAASSYAHGYSVDLGDETAVTPYQGSGTPNALNILAGIESDARGSIAAGANTIGAVTQASGPWTVSWSGQSVTVSSLPALSSGTNTIGYVNFPNVDPCLGTAPTQVAITLTAPGATQIVVAGVSAKKIYVCKFNVLTGAANNVAISEGTSTNCGTGETAVIGAGTHSSPTNGYQFGANGGIALTGTGTQFSTQVNADGLCVTESAAGPLSGVLTYVQQ